MGEFILSLSLVVRLCGLCLPSWPMAVSRAPCTAGDEIHMPISVLILGP